MNRICPLTTQNKIIKRKIRHIAFRQVTKKICARYGDESAIFFFYLLRLQGNFYDFSAIFSVWGEEEKKAAKKKRKEKVKGRKKNLATVTSC